MKAVVAVLNESNGLPVGERIVCANTTRRRLVGLLGTDSLDSGGGIWITPSSGVHTIGMTFPIDVIGLDHHLRVIRLWPRVKPYRFSPLDLRVKSVLELAAGEISLRAVEIGHQLAIHR